MYLDVALSSVYNMLLILIIVLVRTTCARIRGRVYCTAIKIQYYNLSDVMVAAAAAAVALVENVSHLLRRERFTNRTHLL